jgi:methyltransferase (TIGR00027 family)
VREKPSRTAAFVALLRGLGDERFRDPIAPVLLPTGWRLLYHLLPRPLLLARARLLVARSLAVDAETTAALAAGAQQVVILGAGLDGRAHRLSALREAHVFEVDHPASQSFKRRAARRLQRTCRGLSYVSCDFERDDLAAGLRAAGHRDDEPTVWIWEGVTLYLDDEAIRATLASISVRSAEGSTLLVEYHDAEIAPRAGLYSFVRRILLAIWSEPQIGARSQAEMHAELAGFRIERDFSLISEGRARLAVATRLGARRAPSGGT